MSSHVVMTRCKNCEAITQHIGPATSHVLHLLMTVFTAGLWIPVWVIIAMNNPTKAKCSRCGRMKGVLS